MIKQLKVWITLISLILVAKSTIVITNPLQTGF